MLLRKLKLDKKVTEAIIKWRFTLWGKNRFLPLLSTTPNNISVITSHPVNNCICKQAFCLPVIIMHCSWSLFEYANIYKCIYGKEKNSVDSDQLKNYIGRHNLYPKTGIDDPKGFWCPKNESAVQTFPIYQDFGIS